jgi:hypothetical protein
MRIRTVLFMTGAAAVTAAVAYGYAVRPWWRSWGVDPATSEAPLPGDDLVPDATVVDTRAIEIAAPPARVWPWLVQLGHGRGGWYSYDAMDMKGKSADTIVAEWQTLAAGDMVAVAPGSGFVVRELEPGRALVLYLDKAIVAEQAEKAAATRGSDAAPVEATEPGPTNVKAFGAAWSTIDFAASWAVVLEPLDGGIRTRLVERMRVRATGEQKGIDAFLSVFGFGAFMMLRKQMLGIRDRVERAIAADAEATPEAAPAEAPAPG